MDVRRVFHGDGGITSAAFVGYDAVADDVQCGLASWWSDVHHDSNAENQLDVVTAPREFDWNLIDVEKETLAFVEQWLS